MKPRFSVRPPRFADVVPEKEVTVVLPGRDLDVLIALVETNLAALLVYGCDDRRQLTALKRCRGELRAARTNSRWPARYSRAAGPSGESALYRFAT